MIKKRHSVKTNRLAVAWGTVLPAVLAQGAGNARAQTVVISAPAPLLFL